MADQTHIEWTDATWNPITGCTVHSAGCTNCYAMKLAGTRLASHPSRAGLTRDTKAGPVWTGEVRFNEGWLDQPLRWSKPRMIFVCAHADLFHEDVPDEWIDRIFAVMALCPQHVFQVLTKRSARMRDYISKAGAPGQPYWSHVLSGMLIKALGGAPPPAWPLPNVWLGVSVEDQRAADERIPDLLSTPAAIRWLSCEPLLGPVDLRGFIRPYNGPRRAWSTWNWPDWVPAPAREQIESFWRADSGRGPCAWLRGALDNGQPPLGTRGQYELCREGSHLVEGRFIPAWNNIGRVLDDDGNLHVVSAGRYQSHPPFIKWVVVGGENGPRPVHPDWVRSIRDQCAAASTPFFLKQWGTWRVVYDRDVDDPDWQRCGEIKHATPRGQWLNLAGGQGFHGDRVVRVEPVSKKIAGRLLDGVEHNGMPSISERTR